MSAKCAAPPCSGAKCFEEMTCSEDNALQKTAWAWQGVPTNDTRLGPAVPGEYTLTFLANGKVEIQSDCNEGQGNYSAHEPRIRLEEISVTERGCLDSLEKEFFEGLKDVVTYWPDGNTLSLRLGDGSDMVFASQDGATSFQDTVWVWQYTRLGVLVVPEDFQVAFLAGGELGVKMGCNFGGGAYCTQGEQIRMEEMYKTQVGCAANPIEDDFMRQLVSATRYQLDGGMLKLQLKRGGEMLFAPAP